MTGDNTKLSSSVTVARYRELELAGDRAALARFIMERFDERYFQPIESFQKTHGFATLAIACLIIETLESFYQGREDTRNASKQMFQDFFARDTGLKVLGTGGDWFYVDIRCGRRLPASFGLPSVPTRMSGLRSTHHHVLGDLRKQGIGTTESIRQQQPDTQMEPTVGAIMSRRG